MSFLVNGTLSAGSPNAWLERVLGEPATTRNWRTVVRLVEKYGSSPICGARWGEHGEAGESGWVRENIRGF